MAMTGRTTKNKGQHTKEGDVDATNNVVKVVKNLKKRNTSGADDGSALFALRLLFSEPPILLSLTFFLSLVWLVALVSAFAPHPNGLFAMHTIFQAVSSSTLTLAIAASTMAIQWGPKRPSSSSSSPPSFSSSSPNLSFSSSSASSSSFASLSPATRRRHLLALHELSIYASLFTAKLGVISIMVNKVVRAGKGIIFVDRSPTRHAIYGLLWLVVATLLVLQGWLLTRRVSHLACLLHVSSHTVNRLRTLARLTHAPVAFGGVVLLCLSLFSGAEKTGHPWLAWTAPLPFAVILVVVVVARKKSV